MSVRKASLLSLFCLLQLAACSPAPFQPEQISCHDMSSHKLVEKVDKIHREGRDAYVLDHFDEMLPLYKKLADQGNVNGMAYYGRFQLLALILPHAMKSTGEAYNKDNVFNKNDEALRTKTINAFSYLYVFSMQKKGKDERDLELVAGIDSGKMKDIIPAEWKAEAKANAESWKAHCGK